MDANSDITVGDRHCFDFSSSTKSLRLSSSFMSIQKVRKSCGSRKSSTSSAFSTTT
jgi:hypothetical protein